MSSYDLIQKAFKAVQRSADNEAALSRWRHPIRRRRGQRAQREVFRPAMVVHPNDVAGFVAAWEAAE